MSVHRTVPSRASYGVWKALGDFEKNSKQIGRYPSGHRTMNLWAPKTDRPGTERWPSGHRTMFLWVELPTVEILRVFNFLLFNVFAVLSYGAGRISADFIIHRRKPATERNVTTHLQNVIFCPLPGRFSTLQVSCKSPKSYGVSYICDNSIISGKNIIFLTFYMNIVYSI